MSVLDGSRRTLAALSMALCVAAGGVGRVEAAQPAEVEVSALPAAEDFSPAFLGMYRKVMEIEDAIDRFSEQYGVDPLLARAVCMFESGGNADVVSGAGARGYFQVIPSTFRLMRVPTNIEAGIKYLSQLVKQFGREDYALAAYNGGPGRVARGRAMPLESLQYVIGVGYYRSVLKMYEPAVRAHASNLGLVLSRAGDDWAAVSARLGVPILVLRLYNPLVSDARMRRSAFQIAYPRDPVPDLFDVAADGQRRYRARLGDNYINLAIALDVDVNRFRDANGLWRLQVLPVDMMLAIPSPGDAATIGPLAEARPRAPQVRVAANPGLVDRPDPAARVEAARPVPSVHRVRRGETLTEIARRYGTTIRAIQRLNRLGRRTMIRAGERLRIPN